VKYCAQIALLMTGFFALGQKQSRLETKADKEWTEVILRYGVCITVPVRPHRFFRDALDSR
jgi:hypothetical protein